MRLVPLVAIVLVAAGPPIGAGKARRRPGPRSGGSARPAGRASGSPFRRRPSSTKRRCGPRGFANSSESTSRSTRIHATPRSTRCRLLSTRLCRSGRSISTSMWSGLADWRMQGYLMRDRDPFRAVGMFPPEREGLVHGYSIDHEMWLTEQPTAYYRRHLLLHEGTHGFMNTLLGTCGPGWYMEGVAELLGTHRWDGKQLTLGVMPTSREDVPGLGRDSPRAGRLCRGSRPAHPGGPGDGQHQAARKRSVRLVLGAGEVPRCPPAISASGSGSCTSTCWRPTSPTAFAACSPMIGRH